MTRRSGAFLSGVCAVPEGPRRLILALFLLAATSARALSPQTGTTAADFLQIGAGARSLGMGEAYSAVAEGPDAVYWNPAGLGRMTRSEATYSRTELPAGVHHDFLALGVPSSLLGGTIAVGVTRLSQDKLALVNASNQNQGTFAPHSEVYALSYGRDFTRNEAAETSRDYLRGNWNIPHADKPFNDDPEPWTGEIAFGFSAKAVHESLGTRSASAFAFDGGGTFRPADLHELILAGAVRNVGTRMRFISESEPLPGELAASAAYDARSGEWRLLPALEIEAPYAGAVYGKLGFEASRPVGDGMRAAARIGYNSRTTSGLGVLSGLTAGVGLGAGSFSFDAAFQPMAVLGQSLRVGIDWKF